MGKARKKSRTHVPADPDADAKVPRSMVFTRGKATRLQKDLVADIKRMMEPYTARRLRMSANTKLRDLHRIAGPMGASHFVIVTATTKGPYLKVARYPNGPTATFKIHGFSLIRDVASMQKRPVSANGIDFRVAPLVVLSGFGASTDPHVKITQATLQHMFPSLKVDATTTSSLRRVVLFSRNAADDMIEMRHYAIRMKKLNQTSLKKLQAMVRGDEGYATSESEGEEVETPDAGSSTKSSKVGVKLREIGPRLRLRVVKIEEGVCSGKVLYHRLVQKSAEDVQMLEQKKKEKEARRLEQERRVAEKKAIEDEKKQKKKQRRQDREKQKDAEGADSESEADEEEEEDEEAEGEDETMQDVHDDEEEEDEDDDDDDDEEEEEGEDVSDSEPSDDEDD